MEQKHQFFMSNQSQNKEQKTPVTHNGKTIGGPSSALIKYVVDIGANKQTIDQIATKINFIMQKADIKVDDEDQIEPMRKLEIKFLELYEQKKIIQNRSAEEAKWIEEIQEGFVKQRKH